MYDFIWAYWDRNFALSVVDSMLIRWVFDWFQIYDSINKEFVLEII